VIDTIAHSRADHISRRRHRQWARGRAVVPRERTRSQAPATPLSLCLGAPGEPTCRDQSCPGAGRKEILPLAWRARDREGSCAPSWPAPQQGSRPWGLSHAAGCGGRDLKAAGPSRSPRAIVRSSSGEAGRLNREIRRCAAAAARVLTMSGPRSDGQSITTSVVTSRPVDLVLHSKRATLATTIPAGATGASRPAG